MNREPPHLSAAQRYALAVLLCVLIALVTHPLLGTVDLANIALLFVLIVVLCATYLGRGPAFLASFVAVGCFDFFFVQPRYSLTVADVQYLITFAVLLLTSMIISQLTNAYRDKAIEVEHRVGELAMLHELAASLSGAPTVEEVCVRLEQLAQRDLHTETTLFLPEEGDAGEVLFPLGPGSALELAMARDVYLQGERIEHARELRTGFVTGLYPLEGATRRRGVLAVHFREDAPGCEPTLFRAMATLVTTAVERIHFVEVANEAALLARTERMRGAILSALSHDLRTPLTVLFGLADALAQREGLPAEERQAIGQLRDQTHRLRRMVENLLDLARLRSGRIELRTDWQSLPELIGATVQAMQPWLDSSRLRFEDAEHELPLVRLDAVLMERVLCNLLENAAKYSPAGSPIVIRTRVSADAHWLSCVIENDGAEIPPERLARIFEIFERGNGESPVPGSGVGLAICHAIIDIHGGHIRASNRAGGGVSMRIDLPLTAAPAIPEESAP